MASLNPLQGVLGQRRAAHLLRRTSFRFTKAKVDELASMSAAQALAQLLSPNPLQLDQPVFAENANDTPATWINPPQPPTVPLPTMDEELLTRYVMAWWVHEAAQDPGATHKVTYFLHQFLAVNADAGSSMEFYDYLLLLRWGSLGNFKKLLMKVIVDNCMLAYIDNDQNYVNNPNENYAREFFELHTIGRGAPAGPGDYTNYTEDDIVEAARVLTGFNHAQRHQYQDPETGIPAGKAYPQSHDFNAKTFSARFNGTIIQPPSNDADGMNAELQALVDMVFAQEETARNFCRRLYHFFVTRNIPADVELDIIGGLAQTFSSGGFEIMPVLEQLLQSEHFYDMDDSNNADEIVGALIKSPMELALQTFSFFDLPIPDPVAENHTHYRTFYNSAVIGRMFDWAGLYLFNPPDVAGYPGYYQDPDLKRQFFNSATIVARYKVPEMLLTGTLAWGPSAGQPLGTKFDFAAWLRDSGVVSDPSDPYVLVQDLLTYLFPEASDTDRLNYFIEEVFLDTIPANDWTYEWSNYTSSGDDFEVKIPLQRLYNAILYAPEYQVF
ncbi:MAG: DUF1800 family protein [Lewinellaceae bacterium]|nr:DUF1800 family protein [Lewinellaceae bacterium]